MKEHDPTGKPMIVFAGRSNVGKSSTIRALTGKRVRIGKKPGSTRWELMIDFGSVTVVDIPGFGYMAGQSKTTIEETKTKIVQKLESWKGKIVLAVLIIDVSLFRELYERWSNRDEIPIDVEFYSFLCEITPNVIVVANKADKVKPHILQEELNFLQTTFKQAVQTRNPIVVLTSAPKKRGISELSSLIDDVLVEQGLEKPRWVVT
jgi:GTP-binding protein EngB required for normal cell division